MNNSALIGMWQGSIEEIMDDSFEAKLNDGRDDYYVEFSKSDLRFVDAQALRNGLGMYCLIFEDEHIEIYLNLRKITTEEIELADKWAREMDLLGRFDKGDNND